MRVYRPEAGRLVQREEPIVEEVSDGHGGRSNTREAFLDQRRLSWSQHRPLPPASWIWRLPRFGAD